MDDEQQKDYFLNHVKNSQGNKVLNSDNQQKLMAPDEFMRMTKLLNVPDNYKNTIMQLVNVNNNAIHQQNFLLNVIVAVLKFPNQINENGKRVISQKTLDEIAKNDFLVNFIPQNDGGFHVSIESQQKNYSNN